jgi:uncharacterized protein
VFLERCGFGSKYQVGFRWERIGDMHIDVAHLVHEVETAWIPLSDGRRLAARLFLPNTALQEPVPVILEYIPYRRRDLTRLGDEAMHRWFAAHGYASVRVDIAGMGDSDGLMNDEYVKREQDDAIEVIAWLAAQPWSSGSVGIIGISWGGFNGLQIAARRPPALKAIITVCSTVDRYHGDVHFSGGCLNEENLEWGACLFTMNGFPPDPAIVGEDRWRELWRARVEGAKLAPADWLEHQTRDDFWKQGSVIEDYSAIDVPVLALSGWVDGYTRVVFDLVENVQVPRKGIVGPWGHKYPQDGIPGPAIGFLQEALRWWDKWLRGIDTGVDSDRDMRIFLQDSQAPTSHIQERRGGWVGFDNWPSPEVSTVVLRFSDGSLLSAASDNGVGSICSPLTTGLTAGQWCAYGQGKIAPELSTDQRADDIGSLVYDSEVIVEPLNIIGEPVISLRVSSDQPSAFVAVRLSDVHPDGTVERLSYGVFNVCHHSSDEFPSLLVPGVAVDFTLKLKALAQTVPVGHRLRVSISTSYWPMIWPSPVPATVTIHHHGSSIALPTYDTFERLPDTLFEPPEDAQSGHVTVLRPGSETRHMIRSLGDHTTEFRVSRDDGDYRLEDTGTELSFTRIRSSSVTDGDPLSAKVHVTNCATFRRGDWDVRVETTIEMTCDQKAFYFTATFTTFDGGEVFIERHFDRRIPRHFI